MTDSSSFQPANVVIATMIPLSAGATYSFYLGSVGFFVVTFRSRVFLAWMILCVFCTFPFALYLQEKFDSSFDKMFSTRVTFFFRVMLVPVVMAGIMGVLIFVCTKWLPVLICGSFLGFCYAATVGSSMQMAVSWHPLLVVWAQIGNQLGSATPVIGFWLFSFTPMEATVDQLQKVLVVPLIICCINSVILMYLHFRLEYFENVYRRLSYGLSHDDEDPPASTPLKRGASDRSDTEKAYLGDDVDSLGVPLWVPKYNALAGINAVASYFILPFATFFGNANLAQTLVLAKFAMDFLGRFAILGWGHLNQDLLSPIHLQVGAQVTVRYVVAVILGLDVFQVMKLHHALFMTLWCYFFFSEKFLASQLDLLCARVTPISQRKVVSRRNVGLTYLGILIGVSVALVVQYRLNPSFFHSSMLQILI